MFQFAFDSRAEVLSVCCVGAWTLPEIERYAQEAGTEFARARQLAGRLRLLIDLSQQELLTQEMVAPLARAGMQHARHDDRVALAVRSTLMKLQTRRMIGDAPTPIFLSAAEASAWLALPDDRPAAAAL